MGAGTRAPTWVSILDYGTADPSGSADSTAAIQGAINALPAGGGDVSLPGPSATYKTSSPLVPVPGLRLHGDSRGAGSSGGVKISNSASAMFDCGGATLLDSVEIDHLTLSATNYDIFSGANVARWNVHDCRLIQNSAGAAIWNAPTVTLMIECVFKNNLEYVYGATRTIEAWFLSSPSGSAQVNQNQWKDCTFFNQNSDATHYYHHLQNTGSNSAANTFDNCVYEHAFGGMIWLESQTRCLIRQCYAYDVASASGTISNHLVYISKNAAGLASSRNTIINGARNQSGVAFAAGVGDIGLDSACQQTTIISPEASGDLVLYLGGSTGVKIVNIGQPAGAIKDSATTAAAGAGAGTSAPAPVVTAGPTNESGTITWGTGTTPAAGNQVSVTFGTPFSVPPNVQVSPTTGHASTLGIYVTGVSATGFVLACGNTPAASQADTYYGFTWRAEA